MKMVKKLSPTMQKALDALPLNYSTWGSQPWTHRFPKGVTMATIRGLKARGLVEIIRNDAFHKTVVRK